MNSLGLSIILKMGCICSKEVVYVNDTKYHVLEHLGEGGFSKVDLVENATTKKKFALKRITSHSREDQNTATREIEAYKQIRHVNVIELIDSEIKGFADIVVNMTSEALLVLPYFRRGTLHDVLESRGRNKDHYNTHDVLSIFLGICEGLRALHEAAPEPLAHRDLKTANVCLGDDCTPVIMDLGSATEARVKVCGTAQAQQLQELAAERCSMPYRAPELFNVESYCMVDERSDIWSLGCVLYALCFFKSPFDAVHERGDSVALAVISGNVTFPEGSPYDESLHSLVMSMLRVNPMERPYIYSVIERAQELQAELQVHA